MTEPSATDLLFGSKVPGLKMSPAQTGFNVPLGGRIVAEPKTYHVREYDRLNPGQGPLKYFPSGDPIYGLQVDVQTDDRDPSIEDDDGVRRMYLEKKRQLSAVRTAVREAGAKGLAIGGVLHMTCTGTEGDLNAQVWTATYVAPVVGIPTGEPDPAPTVPAQPAAPAAPPQQAAAAAALANLSPEQLAQLQALAAQQNATPPF